MKTGTMSRSRGIATGLTYLFLIAGSLLMIFPFLWMILTSLKSLSESVQIPPTIFPAKIVWSNFKDALTSLPFVNLYINTIIMVLVRVICAIVFSSMAGYAFAKLHFKGKNLLFTLVLVQMMMPSQIFVIPQYQMLAKVSLTESIFALIFPGLVIIGVIAAFLSHVADNPWVGHAFAGVRAAVCALILSSVLKLRKTTIVDPATAVLFAVVFLLSAASVFFTFENPVVTFFTSPVVLVVLAGLTGLGIRAARGWRK